MYMKGLTLTIIASLVLSSSVLGKDIKGRIIDENDNTIGKKNLAEALNKNISVSVTETINILDTEIKNFVGNKEQSDDITMVALEYFGAGSKEAK